MSDPVIYPEVTAPVIRPILGEEGDPGAAGSPGAPGFTLSDAAPADTTTIWVNSLTGGMYAYIDGFWVEVGVPDAVVGAATTIAAGVVELATDAEAIDGTDTARAVTPAALAAAATAGAWAGGGSSDPLDGNAVLAMRWYS